MINTEQQKVKLLEEKKVLEGELSNMGSAQNEADVWVAKPLEETAPEADENDLADRNEDFEEKSSTTEILAKRLTDVNTALTNIESGNYGVCTICGNNIEEDRLEANPAAQTCKVCM